ncbi:hypothetical protein [Vibrio sp. TBV020]|uniref:hypothetical protein n=1 Tax=Vibrio sp. TBV020 TaxID=3137398 RepID=UPI0038CD5079
MNNEQIIMAKSQDGLAIVELDKNCNITSFVSVGGIQEKQGYTYKEVPVDALIEVKSNQYPTKLYKYKNDKIYLPVSRKAVFNMKSWLSNKCHDLKHWYKKSSLSEFFYVINILLLPLVLLSLVAALAASYIAVLALGYINQSLGSNTVGDFIAIFIPTLTVFITLLGIYTTLKETRLISENQKKAAVKPIISIVNNGTPEGKPDHTQIICLDSAEGDFLRSEIKVENVGLATARNILLFRVEGNRKTVHHYGFSLKFLKPEQTDIVEVQLSKSSSLRDFILYSRCENVYGDAIFHAHHFYAKTNGENVFHMQDRQLTRQTKELRMLEKLFNL